MNVIGLSLGIEAHIRALVLPYIAELKKTSCPPEIGIIGEPLVSTLSLREQGAIVHEVSDGDPSRLERLHGIKHYPINDYIALPVFRADIIVCNLKGLGSVQIERVARAIRRTLLVKKGEVYLHIPNDFYSENTEQKATEAMARYQLQKDIEWVTQERGWLGVYTLRG